MRFPTLAALTFATLVANSGVALAIEYPWCLIEGRRGVWSCGYVSFEQCMATRVATEMCNINPRYPFAAAGVYGQPRKVKRTRP